MRVAIIGSGSWGTALANLLANKGDDVSIWDADEALLADIVRDRENKKYLPGRMLHDGIQVSGSIGSCLAQAAFVVTAVPAQHFRKALTMALPYIPKGALVVNVAKGIELETLMTLSRVYAELAPGRSYAILSGPSHAEEVADGVPTTVVAAAADPKAAEAAQELFMTERFRVYTQSDVVGVELGGALKNVIALGAGISDGMGYGDNTKAAIMTRGITEMTRLGQRMGARYETFFGLSGIGDLIVTCTSMHSRNRRCGIMIGEGIAPQDAIANIGMVVEGIPTAEAAMALARKIGVEMPITEAICRIVGGEVSPETALAALMTREKKHEQEDVKDIERDR